jgi:hypothetical protein
MGDDPQCGDVYVGEWHRGQPHGHGACTFKRGNAYEGGWKKGGYHGKGVYSYANGDRFEGTWKDDERHGGGTFTDATGSVWRETYENGELRRRWAAAEGAGGGSDPSFQFHHRDGSGDDSNSDGGAAGAWANDEQMYDARRKLHDERWKIFERNPPEVIDHGDVPWPPPGDLLGDGVGRRGPPISTAELKRRCKDFMMRWHPDKWIGRKLCEENRERIMRDVTNVFRRIDQEKQRNGL